MAHASGTRHAHQGASLLGQLNLFRADLAERLARHRHYRRTLDELSWLTDRELTDLGIHRSQIPEIARDAAYKS